MDKHGVTEVETSKDQIAKATLWLVADRGIDRVTMSDVVKTLGITRAEMARHCPTEDDLWFAVAVLIEKRMKQTWSTVAGGPSPYARLRSLLAVQIGLIMGMPVLRTMLLSGGLHAHNALLRQELSSIRQGFRALLVEVLIVGQRTGQFCGELDAEITADRIMEAIQGMVVSWSLNEQAGDPVEEVWVRLDAFLRAAADRPHPGSIDHDLRGLS